MSSVPAPAVPSIRPGVRLGVDVGSVRIGVAASDPEGRLALPVETIPRSPTPSAPTQPPDDARRIGALVAERGAVEVVVGLPVSLRGTSGPAVDAVLDYARRLAAVVRPVPVRVVDERFTTVAADRRLQGVGVRGRVRRQVVDQLAAAVLLQDTLDRERATGRPPGRLITADGDPDGEAGSS